MNRTPPAPDTLRRLIDHARQSFDKRQFDDSAALFLQALEIAPDSPDLCFGAANALRHIERFGQAVELYRRAISRRADFFAAHCNLGAALKELGRFDESIAAFETAYRLRPETIEIGMHLAELFMRQSQSEDARRVLTDILERHPDSAKAWNALGNTAMAQKDPTAAKEHYLRALRIRPDFADAHYNLGTIMREWDQLDEAVVCYRNAEKFAPGSAALQVDLGITLQLLGETEASEACFRQARTLDSTNQMASHNLLISINYNHRLSAAHVVDAHRQWGASFVDAPSTVTLKNSPDADQPLRIGYLSPDFCNHPAAAFLEPMVRYHNRERFEVYCYAETIHDDPRTVKFRELADHWKAVEHLSDHETADQIRNDRIDILVDTAGHLNGNRLGVFALRAAPLQISSIGYPGGTGLPAMDYRISDSVIDPADTASVVMEQPLRLDHGFCCYHPPENLPPVASSPALKNRYVTFGSLHTTARLNEQVIARWSSVLRAAPTSRMIICRTTLTPSVVARLSAWFDYNGIDGNRIDYRAQIPAAGHLTVYNDIDISLDTLPWSGHTTACESLIMGVPVITRFGDRPAGRMVASVLASARLPQFVARSDHEFESIAVNIAASFDELADLRSQLRDRVLASRLCDGPGYTNELEAGYRAIWRKWCEGQQPAGIFNG